MTGYTPYYPSGWEDFPNTTTPIDAVALNHMEAGIAAAGSLSPSGDQTGVNDAASIAAAVAAMPTVTVNNGTSSAVYHVGQVSLGPGTWYVATGSIGNIGPFVGISGAGRTATLVYAKGSGDTFRSFNAIRPADDTFDSMLNQAAPYGLGANWAGMTIDGSQAGAGSTGIHIGDFEGATFGPGLTIQHFNGAGSTGILFDNQVAWTESFRGHIDLWDNTTAVVFNGTGGATGDISFAYSDLSFKVYANATQNAVVLQGGAFYYQGEFRLRANMANSTSPQSNALITMTGSGAVGHVGAGQGSGFYECFMQVQAETDLGGTHYPQTINFGTLGSNELSRCYGSISFINNWTPTNYTLQGGGGVETFTFAGRIDGDPNLGNSVGNGGFQIQGALLYAAAFGWNSGGETFGQGDFIGWTLSGNTTISFQRTPAGPQRKIIELKQQSGGGATVTWPHNASPSLNNATVLWPGGVAPVMTATANAVDVYELVTFDGITWYGRVIGQNVS